MSPVGLNELVFRMPLTRFINGQFLIEHNRMKKADLAELNGQMDWTEHVLEQVYLHNSYRLCF